MSVQLFLDSIKSEETRKSYERYLRYYGLDNLAIQDSKTIESQLINFGFNMLEKIKKFRKELVEDFSKI